MCLGDVIRMCSLFFTGDIVHDGFHHLVNRFGKTLASTVVCAQPEHACALFGVTRWHVRRNTELHFGATIRSRSRVVIHAGVCVYWCLRFCVIRTMLAVKGILG